MAFARGGRPLPLATIVDLAAIVRARAVGQTPHESERQLAEALVEESSSEFTSRLIAAQIHATQQVLVDENQQHLLQGASAEEAYPDAVTRAEHGFRWLERGLGDILRREPGA